MTTATQIRASDDERERSAATLREAEASGRSSDTELDDRLAAVSAARFRDELDAAVVDLPSEQSAPKAAPSSFVGA